MKSEGRPRLRASEPRTRSFASPDYRALAEFRFQLRAFLAFSEQRARAAGLEPQQHQALLALKGLPESERPTVRSLADRLQLRHHTVVGLVDRLTQKGLVTRRKSAADAREILVSTTLAGERILRRLSRAHREELATAGPALVRALEDILASGSAGRGEAHP